MNWGEKPVLILGHGVRCSGVDPKPLLELGVPILTSWTAKDLVDNWHFNYYGCPGAYGQRAANRILFEADTIVSLGCRLPLWVVGWQGIRPHQKVYMVDIDQEETTRFPQTEHIGTSIHKFMDDVNAANVNPWQRQCDSWRTQYPWLEQGTHDDVDGYINSYHLTARLEPFLKPDQVIITDAGCNMCPAFQVLRIKPPQRLMTSGGLGEMGCALPGSIGASFARDKGEVLCIVGDGGFMLNLQELQTIRHHNLPIKIIVFRNEGYAMIQHSQKALGYLESGVGGKDLSFPDFVKVGESFGIHSWNVRTWDDFENIVPQFFNFQGPALIQYWQHPNQKAVPKLDPIRNADGTIGSPEFWNLSPRLA